MYDAIAIASLQSRSMSVNPCEDGPRITPTLSGPPLKYFGADAASMMRVCHSAPIGFLVRYLTGTGFQPRPM